MKHRELIDPRNYVCSYAKDDVYWDLPNGDTELRIDIRADRKFRLYLRAGDDTSEFVIPLGVSDHHQHSLRIRDIKGVYGQFDSPTNVAAQIRHKSIKISEQPWGDPVVVVSDPEEPTDIRALIAREMAYLRDDLTEQDKHEFVGLDDDEMDYDYDGDEEFGEGLMEPPEHVIASEYERVQRGTRKRRLGSNNPDASVDISDDEGTRWEDSEPEIDRGTDKDADATPSKVTLKDQIKKVIDRY